MSFSPDALFVIHQAGQGHWLPIIIGQKKFGANIVASVSGSGTTAPRLRSEGNSLRHSLCSGPGPCLVERWHGQLDPSL
jgi:hypothetical protein